MNLEDALDFFPYGVHYHRAPTPRPDEWDGDLMEIARCGYTHIQFRPQWRWHERLRGKPVWDDLDRLFSLAQRHRLRVILKPMLETAPDWVFSELKGTRIGFHGVPLSPFASGAYYVGGWWPCFDNTEVVSAACEFVATMVRRYQQHPALWIYNAWNEPCSRPTGQCQCPYSVASYRAWLKERFGSIEQLNDFYGKAWTSFESILPPSAADDYAEMFLWRRWAASSVAHQVQFVSQTIRRVDPRAFIMVHVGSSQIVQDSIYEVSDDLLNAKQADRYGTSFGIALHPKTPLQDAGPDLQSDWIRRVDPCYWNHEFYTNTRHWAIPPTPANLRRLLWMALSGGPAGFTFWQWRSERVGNEVNDAGMRESDGSPTERSQVCDEAAAILRKHGQALIGARRVPSDIAILHCNTSDMIMRLQDTNDWRGGVANEPKRYGRYKVAVQHLHAMYLQMGQTIDWVVPLDDLSAYRLLHVTVAEMVDSATAQWLRQYVRQGGKLVVEFPFACRDENTWVSARRPNHALEDLLGCKEAERLVLDPAQPDTARFDWGAEIEPAHWRFMLQPTSGHVLAKWRDGRAAAVVNNYGAGQVLTLGVNLALVNAANWSDTVVDTLRRAVRSLGISLPEDRPLWVRKRRSKDREVWFVFNTQKTTQCLKLAAEPKSVWIAEGASLNHGVLTLPAGGTWVAEMPV